MTFLFSYPLYREDAYSVPVESPHKGKSTILIRYDVVFDVLSTFIMAPRGTKRDPDRDTISILSGNAIHAILVSVTAIFFWKIPKRWEYFPEKSIFSPNLGLEMTLKI